MLKRICLATLVAATAFAAWDTPTNLGASVNSSADEWYPFISEDGRYIVFASNRAGGQGNTDLWRTDYAGGTWQTPVNMGTNVNTASGESVPYLSYNESRLYFISACPGGEGYYDIWWCPITGGTAGPKVNLGSGVNTAGLECWPVVTSDGQTLYICSTRAGGYGGHDIWASHKVGGEWQTPENIGGEVNTFYHEFPRWVSADGKILVFMSDRSGGYGGVDMYYTTKSGGAWTTPQNLGSVLNASGDEWGASFRCNRNVIGGIIYFGSTRAGGQGGLDLWTSEDDEFHAVSPTSVGGVKASFR